jgi:hypothetical protein
MPFNKDTMSTKMASFFQKPKSTAKGVVDEAQVFVGQTVPPASRFR